MAAPWEKYQEAATGEGPWSHYVATEADPAAVRAGSALNDIPRQLGLTARYGLEGLANTAQVITEPLRYLTDRATGMTGRTKPLGALATQAADALGLPSPENANERVIGDATRLVAGAGGLAGSASAAAKLPGMVGTVMGGLAANPAAQLTSAGGAGLAGGASREAGGSALEQGGAALIGGVAGGLVPGAAQAVGNVARRALTPTLSPQQLDVQLSSVLEKAGADYSQIPENVRRSLRAELASSLQAGKELDPEAVRRLADFRTVGAVPTRGMVSQNPVQITREQNLAKMAANSADDQLHGLPLMQNQNNQTLIRNLNDAGASRGDPFAAGQQAIGSIAARDAAEQARVTGLYNTARAMPGGNTPLDRTPVVNGIYDALARENKMAFLPPEVSNMLNTISKGTIRVEGREFQVPFDANALDNLMTTIATAQRGTQDGNVKAALAIARRAIDEAAISPIKNNARVVGNPLVTEQTAAALRGADAEAPAFMKALNEARSAARGRFGWQESSRPVEAALGGAAPDTFVKKFVLGGTLDDAQAVAREAPTAAMKDAIVAHLKEKALSGSADEVGKFSQAAYNKALNAIGDRKLSVFFSPEELTQLRAVGRVASYIQAQPVGSAVNNSNSGALILGRGMDAINSVAGKIPFGRAAIIDPLRSINLSVSQRQAQNVVPGLLAPVERPPMAPSLLLPGVAAAGGLLSAQ